MKQYIFHKNQKRNWNEQLEAVNNSLKAILDDAKSDFIVKIEDYKESSPKALRAYWRLVGLITDHINSANPDYKWSKEEISDIFKEEVGHVVRKDMSNLWSVDKRCTLWHVNRHIIKPKSIARNSGCTYEEMSRLIEKLLQFGSEIPNCVLTPEEDMEFKKYYGVK